MAVFVSSLLGRQDLHTQTRQTPWYVKAHTAFKAGDQ